MSKFISKYSVWNAEFSHSGVSGYYKKLMGRFDKLGKLFLSIKIQEKSLKITPSVIPPPPKKISYSSSPLPISNSSNEKFGSLSLSKSMISHSSKERGSRVDADHLIKEWLLSKEFLNFCSRHYLQMDLKTCELYKGKSHSKFSINT